MSTISSGTTSTTTLIHSGDTTGSLVFKTNDTGSGGTTAVTIDTAQNVGIGTTSPAAKLEAKSTTTNLARIRVTGTGTTAGNYRGYEFASGSGFTGGIFQDESTSNMQFWNNASALMTLDSSGNLGLGVTPSAFFSTWKILQIGYSGSLSSQTATNIVSLESNRYQNGSNNPIYIQNGYASSYYQYNGQHVWQNAPSGTAGNAITFTQAMTLDASGNLGVGTTSPTSIAGYPSVTINGSSGAILDLNAGGSNYGRLSADTAGPNLQAIGARPLLLSTNGSERARIDSSGNLLVGTTSSTGGITGASPRLAVVPPNTTSHGMVLKSLSWAYDCGLIWNSDTTGNSHFFEFGTEATYTARGSITYNRGGGLVAYNTASDYRAKTVNGPVQNALQKLAQLKPSTGRMNGAEQDIDFFVAHELQEVVPSAVTGEKDAVNEDGTPKYQMVDKTALIPLLTAAIQEQQTIIEQLKADVAALKGA